MAPGSAYDDRDGFIWMDGNLVEWRSAKVHLLTHALHYGSAVFEGERAYGGRIFKSEQHSQRLLDSGNAMDIPIPYTVAEIEKAKADTMRANNMKDAYIRVLSWRGSGLDMGVASARNPPSPETIPCHAKASGLYMICTMSKHAAEAKGCSDSLMMDYRGYVAEATGANVFFVKDGAVHTPQPDCFLNGITRQTVVGMMKDKGIEVIERHIMPDELESFEQCWLTGTAAEVTPVGEIGPYNFEVGALTQDIAESYERVVRGNH
jgi:branched-chain amino acid aminotransferase